MRIKTVESALISAQQAKLLASDGTDFDTFGISVAVSGDTAIVGANRNDALGTDAGAAYVFVRNGTSWVQQAKLTAADGGGNDNFGFSVALAGDTAVIGAVGDDDVSSDTGAAYVFVRSGTSWTQQAKLTAADGASDDQLGISVALAGDTAVVGTTNDDDLGDRSGAAYVFVRSGTSWTQQAKLHAADGVEADQFGISVAVSGDTALVGAFGDDDNGTSSGSAYVFVRGGTSWTQQAELTAADRASNDNFGNAVALSGDTALVGAPGDSDLGSASGSAYVFSRSGTSWTQDSKLTAADGASVDLLGVSVGLSGGTAVLGALGDDDRGSSSGSAYVFGEPGGNGGTCTTSGDCASGFCTDGVCCNAACGGGDPGDCQACSVAAGAAVNGTCGPSAAGRVCRGAAGTCDVAESCNGSSTACPADVLASSGTVCRGVAGACDVAERCTGTSAACPNNVFAPSSTVCRPASNGCDLVESCTSSSAACPFNRFKPDLSLCHGGLLGLPGLCLAGICIL